MMRRNSRMIPLKEDGSLDVSFMKKLPSTEFDELISPLTEDQLEYFFKNAFTEKDPIKADKVDYSLEDFDDWGWGVDAFRFMDRMKEKYLKK